MREWKYAVCYQGDKRERYDNRPLLKVVEASDENDALVKFQEWGNSQPHFTYKEWTVIWVAPLPSHTGSTKCEWVERNVVKQDWVLKIGTYK